MMSSSLQSQSSNLFEPHYSLSFKETHSDGSSLMHDLI